MNTFALMQVQVDGSPDEIASISGFDFSWILEDPEDENIEDLIALSLFRNYFAFTSMNHASLPFTDMNPDSTQMIFGVVEDYSTLNGHTQDSASLTCFNERTLKELLNLELQLGEEAIGLPLEEFLELARPHLPPSLEVIQSPITLRIVRATLPPPAILLPPPARLMPTALMDSSPSNYIDVFDILKEKLSNREDVLEGSHTVAKYYPDGDYIEFVAECGLYFGMEETGDFQIEVHSNDSSNSNANFSIELSGIKEWFSINLGNQKFFDMFTPDLEDIDYSFSLEQDESGDYRAYLAIRNLSGRMLGINIDTDADRVLIESEWTPDEEDSGRGVIVNEIPYGISNMQFRTWNTFLAIPNYLPDTITSLERTFESCKNFDSDISNWDTSRVTSLSHTFDGCKSFMQDISSWDVSNVTNMEYAFNGAYNFNSDLSSWDVGKVESFEYAFNATPYFNPDLSQWDTSSARNMFRMFSSSPRFSSIVEDWDVSNVENMDYMFQSTSGETTSLPPQDLSKWCVTKVPFYPSGFIDYDWAGTLPIWGTCPSGDGDSNKISFLKFHQRLLSKDLGQEIGIHYSVNDGEIEKFSFQTVTETSPSVNWGVTGVIVNSYGLGAILGYGSQVFGWETGLPEGLNGDYAFAFGVNEEIVREVLKLEGMELPPEIPIFEENLKLTYYPQSAVNNSSLDFDVFSLLIDPSDYTPEDLAYFEELGVEPATRNGDGSYTIHSVARVPMI